jgi:hypothetical protein
LLHYSELPFDNLVMFLHEGGDRSVAHDQDACATDAACERAALTCGFKVQRVPKKSSFNNGKLKAMLLEQFRRACKEGDGICVADADEFHTWILDPHEALENCDIVTGQRIDRFTEFLAPVDKDMELEDTYPLIHKNLSRLLFPKRPRTRNKIVAFRRDVPVDFRKCTNLTETHSDRWKVGGEIEFNSYKWREGILERLRERTDYAPEELKAIREFFEVRQTA